MDKIFSINNKRSIGFKNLTLTDLGRTSSHQTHIALFESPLDWLLENNLPNCILEAQFVYQSHLSFWKAPIHFMNPKNQGVFRSPTLRSGKGDDGFDLSESLYRHIVKIVEKNSSTLKASEWYLFWASLDFSDQDIVFFLFHSEEDIFKSILNILPNSSRLFQRHIELEDALKLKLIDILESTLDKNIQNFLENLEDNPSTPSEVNAKNSLNRIKPGFFEEAAERNKSVGKRGEKFVDKYLEKLKNNSEIVDFEWVNKEEESGYPYDFEIKLDTSTTIFCDVKSTCRENFDDGNIHLSKGEMKFINQSKNYSIYRVYNVQEDSKSAYLRECTGVEAVIEEIYTKLSSLESSLGEYEKIKKFNLALSPKHQKLTFGEEVNLYLEDS